MFHFISSLYSVIILGLDHELEESSLGFESEHVQELLIRISKLISKGFDEKKAIKLATWINKTRVEKDRAKILNVVYDGKKTLLQITVFMDDYDSPDIGFFTRPELAEKIDSICEDFMEELGM